jgi:Leucine-rich repeat (LRR) protein
MTSPWRCTSVKPSCICVMCRVLTCLSVSSSSGSDTNSLYARGFPAFPDALCELTNLRVLFMTNQRLGAIPSSISKLRNLTLLDIG